MPRPAGSTNKPREPIPPAMFAGINALRDRDEDALEVAKAKAPKQFPDSIISMVMFQGEAVMLLQRPSGKFTVFRKVELAPLVDSDELAE